MDEPLPATSNPPAHYRLEIPASTGWLTSNQRQSWTARYRVVRQWRHDAALYAIAAKIPRMAGARVVAELRFTTIARRDAGNWYETAKACVDGLVDAGVFEDDDSSRVVGPDMRIGPKSPRRLLILHLWPTALLVGALPRRTPR